MCASGGIKDSEAVGKLADAKNAEILERMNDMSEREWLDRKTVLLNAYANILTDEASMMVQMMEKGVIPPCAEDLKSYEGTDLAGVRDVADECSTVMSMRKWATDVESTVAQRFEACAHEMKTTNVCLTELKDLKSQMHLEILNASAQDKTTGELNQISVIYERESSFPAEIHRMVQQAEKYREEVCCAQQQEQQQAQQQEQQQAQKSSSIRKMQSSSISKMQSSSIRRMHNSSIRRKQNSSDRSQQHEEVDTGRKESRKKRAMMLPRS